VERTAGKWNSATITNQTGKAKAVSMNDKISRKEIAELLGIVTQSVCRLDDDNRIPAEKEIIKGAVYYDRKAILNWIETKPLIRPKKKPKPKSSFVYSGDQRAIILFCNPSLLNRMNY
jgi:predicted DNA-binding transcriptional regulator AlpA